MIRILRVGDPHIRPNNIEEANKLMFFIKEVILKAKIDRLEILGDLFHTHAIIRVEVLQFWNEWIQVFSSIVETVIIVGNHDQSGDYHSGDHSLKVFKNYMSMFPRLKIVDVPVMYGKYAYMPYIHNNEEFIKQANSLHNAGATILVCHATFDGSTFENGTYAPGGIDPSLLLFDKVISGHIHKEQEFGKIDYPGTPKWDTDSDANEKKGIWYYEHDDDGKVITRRMISTEHVCRPIISIKWKEGDKKPEFPDNARVSIELIGTSTWISKQKNALKGKASVKSTNTDRKNQTTRSAGKSLEDFILNIYPSKINGQILLDYAKEINIVAT